MGAAEQEADGRKPISSVLGAADAKLPGDEVRAQLRAARPKPTELQAELTAEQRQEIRIEKHLLDGFFKAKVEANDKEVDVADVMMVRNLQAVGRHMVERIKTRT